MAGEGEITLRAATPSDIAEVRRLITEAIDTSPYYSQRFKSQEKARYSARFLRRLIAVDPMHVALTFAGKRIVALIVTIPEYGTLWAPWVYVVPDYQAKAAGITMIRNVIRYWENGGRFHKICCYVRPENRTAAVIYRRFGFKDVALLREHAFGEDMLLMEKPLVKVVEGYDSGVPGGFVSYLRLRLRDAFRF
jgi:RimJ/RimL family protein N-acetyltransferase